MNASIGGERSEPTLVIHAFSICSESRMKMLNWKSCKTLQYVRQTGKVDICKSKNRVIQTTI